MNPIVVFSEPYTPVGYLYYMVLTSHIHDDVGSLQEIAGGVQDIAASVQDIAWGIQETPLVFQDNSL